MAIDPSIMKEFIAEAMEHLATVEDEILALERGEADSETVNRLFRALHSIKGSSSFLGLTHVTALAHVLENVAGKVRSGTLIPNHDMAEALLRGADRLEAMIHRHDDPSLTGQEEIATLERLLGAGDAEGDASEGRPAAPKAPAPGPEQADARVKASAPPQAPPPLEPSPDEPSSPSSSSASTEPRRADANVRISVPLLDRLMNLASELVLVRNQNMQAVATADHEQLVHTAQRLSVVTSDLQASIMQTRMRPIGGVFTRFNRIARDLAWQVKKEVDLEILGADVELDKNIIDALGDPLNHLVRNAISHGIETPAEREAVGKPRRGMVRLFAFHRHGQVNIQIEDDGQGMDPDQIVAAAQRGGQITADQAEVMTTREAYNLVFLPGFSLAKEVTDLAGRGVGMDVVKDTFGRFGGTVDIFSTSGSGTRVTVQLPLTLAIVPALIVAVEGSCFAIPQVNIDEVVWLHGEAVHQDLKMVDDQEVYWLRGRLLPVLRLSKVLDLTVTFADSETGERAEDRREQRPDRRGGEGDDVPTDLRKGPMERRCSLENSLYLIVLRLGEEEFGLLVDTIVDTEEIVVKALHDHLKHSRAFAGTAVLGDGRIAMILDVAALVGLGGLRFGQLDGASSHVLSSAADHQTVILFDLGGQETFAVPLRLIYRVEEVPREKLLHASGREFLDFRGQVIPLVHIEEALGDLQTNYEEDKVYVLIPKHGKPIGVLAANILDTMEVSKEIDSSSMENPAIVGSAMLEDSLTLFVDLFQIIDAVKPGWLELDRENQDSARRVLLLEDSAFYAALISPYLRNAGHEVVHVQNGLEGLEKLSREDFDLVVSDIEMPMMGGLEFARKVREQDRYADLRMVAISAMTDPNIDGEARRAGFNEFRSKLDQDSLLDGLTEICSPKHPGGGGRP